MSPAPKRVHQDISGVIFNRLYTYMEKQKCKTYNAPFDVRLHNKSKSSLANKDIFTVVQPDICVICDPAKLDDAGCIGAPDLIVEILSKATYKKDLDDKFKLYEENGVKEYWIVNPDEKAIHVYVLINHKYDLLKIYDGKGEIPVNIFSGFALLWEEIFFHA